MILTGGGVRVVAGDGAGCWGRPSASIPSPGEAAYYPGAGSPTPKGKLCFSREVAAEGEREDDL